MRLHSQQNSTVDGGTGAVEIIRVYDFVFIGRYKYAIYYYTLT